MTGSIALPRPVLGGPAPDLDLTSTEGCVLDLRDETGRAALLLYFFSDPESETSRSELAALERAPRSLGGPVRTLAVSPAPLDRLRELQRELRLSFPLLRDDRELGRAYGIDPDAYASCLVLVDRHRRLAWMGEPGAPVEPAIAEVKRVLQRLDPSTALLPRSLVNRFVARFGKSTSRRGTRYDV